ncbi:MAG TPA: helix-turn-helix transcriptional regulator [Chloroflexota bacterium]|nr:helix-turn-helix transcriptional regulator [Chloroflexota bacterium]
MIANEVQRRVTQTAIREFEEALAHVDDDAKGQPDWVRKGMREGMESQLADLREELAEYDALRAGKVRELKLESLTELPEALIRARIAAGVSQKELADRLNLKEQQIQRYEATRYAGVSLERFQEVADALGATIHERVVLPTAAKAGAAGTTAHTSRAAGAGRRARPQTARPRRRAS